MKLPLTSHGSIYQSETLLLLFEMAMEMNNLLHDAECQNNLIYPYTGCKVGIKIIIKSYRVYDFFSDAYKWLIYLKSYWKFFFFLFFSCYDG